MGLYFMIDANKPKEELIQELCRLNQGNMPISQEINPLEKRIQQLEREIKQLKSQLATAEERSDLFNNTIVGIYQGSLRGNFVMVNSAFASMLGYKSPEELIDSVTDISQIYVDPQVYHRSLRQVLDKGACSFEARVYRKDGSQAWIHNSLWVMGTRKDNRAYFAGAAQDITQDKVAADGLISQLQREVAEHKSIGEKLKLSQARLEALLKLNQMSENTIKDITDFALEEGIRLTGSDIGYIAFFDEDSQDVKMHSWSKNSLQQCAITYKPIYYKLEEMGLWGEVIRQRRPIIINDYSAPNPFKRGFPMGHVSLVRYMSVPVFDGQRIVLIAGVGNKQEDYDESDVNQLQLLMSGMWRIIQRKKAEEKLRVYRDHLEDMVEDRTNQLKTALAQIKSEVAERKQALESLKLERQRLYSLLDGLPAIIYLRDHDYKISFSNKYFWNLFGRPGDRCCYEVMYNRQEPCEECTLDRVIKTKIPQTSEKTYPNGRIFEVYSYPFQDINGSPLGLELLIDISDRKNIEKEMARLSKLNLIGEMAAGIAHEVRNPMTTVRGFLQLLLQKENYHQDKENFNIMIDELDRANTIITQFLSLTKDKATNLKLQSLNHILAALFPLIQADAMMVDKYVELELNEVPDLLLDKKEIHQLVLNLTRNGLEAMPSGGKITIKTYLDAGEVVLLVQDRGLGIPANIIDKIGTPFFTTKDGGTGLGLATCYSIALRHKARINFDTGPQGTNFYVRFKVPELEGRMSNG